MASTKANNNRVGWGYVSDDGNTYAISAKAVYVQDVTDGAKYGGSLAGASDLRIPLDMKPRKVKCVAASNPDKWVVVYATTAALWTTAGTQITLDANGVDVTYAATAIRRGEKRRDTCREAA